MEETGGNSSNFRRARPTPALILFPANPFVALADFVVVLVLVLMLAFVHQALSSNKLLERVAIDELQKQLLTEASRRGDTALPTLTHYYVPTPRDKNGKRVAIPFSAAKPRFWQYENDGDLQRLRFDNIFVGNAAQPSSVLNPTSNKMLGELGQVLARHQGKQNKKGNLTDPGSGLFKRVIVEGHADKLEGPTDSTTWMLSLSRALTAAAVLERAGLSPELIEVSGRGAYYPAVLPDTEKNSEMRVAQNRYLDVIVVFSGERSLRYKTDQVPRVSPSPEKETTISR